MRLLYLCWITLFTFFPSSLKVVVLRLLGHSVGDDVKIGFSYLDIKSLDLKAGARIGNGNVFKGMQKISMGENASIGRFNIFTCNKYYLISFSENAGRLYMDDRAVVTMRHYFDMQHSVTLGHDSLVAGIQSIFFTHQKGFTELDEAKPIVLGSKVYLGAACKVLPGAEIANHIIIGAGSVVSGLLDEEYSLYASPKAVLVKKLEKNVPYFAEKNPTALIK